MISEITFYRVRLKDVSVSMTRAELVKHRDECDAMLRRQSDRSPEIVIERVCKFYGITRDELLSSERSALACDRRSVLHHLLTAWPMGRVDVGRWAGGKDHSTITHSLRRQLPKAYQADLISLSRPRSSGAEPGSITAPRQAI